MKIIDNKALLIRTKKWDEITNIIPKSAVVEDYGDVKDVMVYWGMQEAQVLKNLRIKNVPSPIMRDYQWPGQYVPFDHQRETAAFLTLHRKSFCFSEAGTGKTNAVIWAADYLMRVGTIKRALIVCPLSIMQSAWQSDLFRTAMHRSVGIAHGSREKRAAVINEDYEFVIINYDGVETVKDVIEKNKFDLIIIDECNAYKSVSTNRWKVMNKIVSGVPWLWMLTGTPAAQSPFDAYGLAKLINPSAVPRFASGFRDLVSIRITQYKWVPRPNAPSIVHAALQPAIRFTKEQCLDLPEMLYSDRDTPLSKTQTVFYGKIKQDMLAWVESESISAVNAGVSINKLLQISAGAVYTDRKDVVEFDISSRYKALTEVIDETNHKVIVFVNYQSVIHMLRDKLRNDNYSVEVINGEVPMAERGNIFHNFQTAAEPKILLIQPQAAAHGVTLHAADTVVWWGPITSAETYLQGNARAHRAGQTKSVTVVHLQGSEVEKRIYKMLRQNIDVHQQLVDLYEELLDPQADIV